MVSVFHYDSAGRRIASTELEADAPIILFKGESLASAAPESAPDSVSYEGGLPKDEHFFRGRYAWTRREPNTETLLEYIRPGKCGEPSHLRFLAEGD
jgi:hypothetical protein